MVTCYRKKIRAVKCYITIIPGTVCIKLVAGRIEHGSIGRDPSSIQRPKRQLALVDPKYVELIIRITD